jgi:hypothetical protein
MTVMSGKLYCNIRGGKSKNGKFKLQGTETEIIPESSR